MSSPAKPVSVVEIKERIRKAGLKSTAPRVAVLRLLETAPTPQSHAEVAQALDGDGFDQATVYRNLMDMTEAALLARVDLGDHVWRFEVRRSDRSHQQEHPHFICTDCGDVTCLPDEVLHLQGQRGTPKSVRQKKVVVKLEGVCDTCLAR